MARWARRWRRASHALGCATAALVTGCVGAPARAEPGLIDVVWGSYAGTLTVEREQFAARLELRPERGTRVRGTFRVEAPFEVRGQASGARIEDLLRITITYESAGPRRCEARIDGILTVAEGGALLEGPVTVADCGTEFPGRMSFRR